MKVYCGSGGVVPHILYLGTRWRCLVSFTPQPLYPQEKRPYKKAHDKTTERTNVTKITLKINVKVGGFNQPMPWRRVLLEKPTVAQLVKKFTACYRTSKFITTLNNSPPLLSIMGKINPVHALPSGFLVEICMHLMHLFTLIISGEVYKL